MGDLVDRLSAHEGTLAALTVSSVVMFVGSLALVPWLVARAPEDLFVREGRPARTPFAWLLVLLKNLLGLVALVLGVLMLFLPGQGLLMVLVAVSLLDFPGKRRLQRRIVRSEKVWKSLSWLRRRAHKPDFQRP